MTKWSDDAFLDGLRGHGDVLADACVGRLIEEGETAAVSEIFKTMTVNHPQLPEDAPRCFVDFFHETENLPPDVDLERIACGEKIFMTHALPAALTLLAKSMPEGYAAPNLALILNLSGDLENHPYKRLLGVLQMVVNVTTGGGFKDRGEAVVSAQKMRLLHAGIRRIVPRHLPDYSERYGVPVNLEDMLGTIMGFSYLVIRGLQLLEVPLTEDEAEDLYYLWQIYSRIVGIHPPGEPESGGFVPADLAEAKEFYEAYARRHYVEAEANPDGVELAQANLRMLIDLIPKPFRLLGLGIVPRIYMQDLIGRRGCERVGIAPVAGHRLLRAALLGFLGLWHWVWGEIDRPGKLHEAFSQRVFQGLIDQAYGGEVTFLIPESMADLRKLA